MGEPVRRLRPRGTPAAPPLPVQPAGPQHHTDLARGIAERYAAPSPPRGAYEARTQFFFRAPHDMLGEEGYSLVSNYFARYVLPQALTQRLITPLQGAVLSNLIGRQKRGTILATQQEVADEIRAGRTSVGPALNGLCELNLVRRVKRGEYQLNPRIAYNGNGDTQRDLLEELRAMQLKSEFPDKIGLPGPAAAAES